MNVGNAIRTATQYLEFSQEELCEKTGLSQTSISQIENSVKAPSKKTIEKIRLALGIPEDVLYILEIEGDDISGSKKVIFDKMYPKIKELAMEMLNKSRRGLLADV